MYWPVRPSVRASTVITEIRRRHRAVEYREFLTAIDKAVPAALDVPVVCDNLCQTTRDRRFYLAGPLRPGRHPWTGRAQLGRAPISHREQSVPLRRRRAELERENSPAPTDSPL
jgi:hypothetical protein